MSTRRARIKAVNFLPLRRKNNETSDNKNKNPAPKDNAEKSTTDSRSPLPLSSANQEENTPSVIKNSSENQNINIETPSKETTLLKSPVVNYTTPVETTSKSNTSTSSHKDNVQPIHLVKNTNIFVSPLRKDSPKKTFVYPVVPSPKVIRNSEQKLNNTPMGRKTPIAQKINESNELQISDNVVNITHNNINNENAREEYSEPGTPSTINDEAMDGIIPLQSEATAPKPIELLKSEIISENAEVLFDPIVPLPSPSKVRPKLRPAPRLGPHRRNSVQGSASESEDESRRSLLSGGNTPAQRQRYDSQISHNTFVSLPNRDVSRVRNDSMCSGVSLITKQPPASPVKEKHTKRSRNERRLNAMRRRENVKRDALTMYDLIFYNPTSNPIVPDEEEINVKEANEKEALEKTKKEEVEEQETPNENAAPVPQIKLGPKGEIIIDEESLVIKQTESDRKVSSVVHEGSWSRSSGYKAKHLRSRDWSSAETVRFYRALAVIGTDFSLMAPLFPDRTRRELKFKFKKEEKVNGAQVDKALRSTIEWDVLRLKEEFKEERALAAKQAEKERQLLLEEKKIERERLKAARETRVRSSRGAKALSSNIMPGLNKMSDEVFTADGIIERSLRPNKRHQSIQLTDTAKQLDLSQTTHDPDYATLTKVPTMQTKTPEAVNSLPPIPQNIETGSLVVLTVDDPSSPAKKMLQTYIARGPGQLMPVALPTTFLNSVVGYMKKNKGQGSPQIMSPGSTTSLDSRSTGTPGIPNISVLPSPAKRQRHSSFTITQL